MRSIGLRASGEADAARQALAAAVGLAEADGWTRFFVDAGPRIAPVLQELARQAPSAFTRRLLDETAAGPAGSSRPRAGEARLVGPTRDTASPMLDPLSDRELEVLRLLGSDLDGPSIARELVVSLNTVRTHTKHIYTKLDVNNRRAAVTKAHQLGLLARAGTRWPREESPDDVTTGHPARS